jgi:hypothetical protein
MRSVLIGLGLALLLAGCQPKSKPEPARSPERSPAVSAPAQSIGSASMLADGTIALQLRATGAGGAVGDGLVRYPKGHAQYEMVLKHVGGLKPGETKPCPPFPDSK